VELFLRTVHGALSFRIQVSLIKIIVIYHDVLIRFEKTIAMKLPRQTFAGIMPQACNPNADCEREKKLCVGSGRFKKCKTYSWDDPQCLADKALCRDWRKRCALASGIALASAAGCGSCIAAASTAGAYMLCAVPCGTTASKLYDVYKKCQARS
jgi:hypothetical protein